MRVNGEWVAIVEDIVHGVRVWASSGPLNGAIVNGGVLNFDKVGVDTDNFAPAAAPFSAITIPAGEGRDLPCHGTLKRQRQPVDVVGHGRACQWRGGILGNQSDAQRTWERHLHLRQ